VSYILILLGCFFVKVELFLFLTLF